MTTRATHPAAQWMLGWMQANPARLRELLDAEAAGAEDLGPAGDPAVRAHLRFVSEALAATAAPAAAAGLEGFARDLPGVLAAREDRVDEEMRRVGEAHAFEAELQFGEGSGEDPAMPGLLDRRVRVAAWTRVFLDALDEARAPATPAAPAVLEWMAGHQDQLADTIFAMDRRAKRAELDRGGPDAIASPEVVNRIGQAATVQAHARFLVEALAARL
ncbi:MAG TPA: hypothetical protein VK904_01920 [Miltoncostaeaceae bacterium]|nr:hypothetical protein [Miltoncostaeaceae bacterium]